MRYYVVCRPLKGGPTIERQVDAESLDAVRAIALSTGHEAVLIRLLVEPESSGSPTSQVKFMLDREPPLLPLLPAQPQDRTRSARQGVKSMPKFLHRVLVSPVFFLFFIIIP